MCGILVAINTNQGKIKALPVNEWILNQYEDQVDRGTEGFGIIMIDDKNKTTIKRATEPLKFLLDLNLYESTKIIAHHRHPTSTDNKIKQTHPIKVSNGSLKYDYLIVHNGVIYNDKEIKAEHEKLGFVYETQEKETGKFNDSEAVAIETARLIEKQIDKIKTRGSMAIVALQIDKTTKTATHLFFFRKTSPLNISKTRGKLRLSSEGEGNPIKENILYDCNIDGDMELKKREIKFDETKEVVRTVTSYDSIYNHRHTVTEPSKPIQSKLDSDPINSEYYNKKEEKFEGNEDLEKYYQKQQEKITQYLEIKKEVIDEIITDHFLNLECSQIPDLNETINQIKKELQETENTIARLLEKQEEETANIK